MCAPPLLCCSLHLPLPIPMQMSSLPCINTPILPSSPALSHRGLFHSRHMTGFLLFSFSLRMISVLRPHFSYRKSSHPASLLLLLLLAGLGSTLVLGLSASGVKPGLEGRERAEGRIRSGVKDKSRDRAATEGNTETEYGNTRVSRPGAATGEDDELGGDSDTSVGFRSMLSMGEGGLWEPRSSSRCVPIPSGMALCQNIGYDTMRMPNLLGHESPAEAVQQSGSWLPLLARECHPDARIFLCSLFAPICLDR